MTNPDVRPFVDSERLVRSEVFAEMVDMATTTAQEVGNLFYVNSLLGLLVGTKHESALLDWVSRRVGISVVVRSGQPHLRKGPTTTGTPVPLERAFPSAVAAQRAALREAHTQAKLNDPRLPVVVVRGSEYQDMLDSPARLPGSYGAGKRR
jgi:hypothetical protein